jgi:hypothetical protein
MYLRQPNKWNEFLLAESSQPAVLLTEITLASVVSNFLSRNKPTKMIRRALDAGIWLTKPDVPGTQGIKPGEFSSFPEDKKDRVVQLYKNHFKDQLLGNEKRGIIGIIPQDLDDSQKALAFTWIVGLARRDDRTAGFLLTGYPGRGVGIEFPAVREDLETFFHYKDLMSPNSLFKTDQHNGIADFDELEGVVLNGRDAIKRHQQSKTYKDFEQGVTLLRGSFLRNEEGQILKRFKIVTGPNEEPVASAVGTTREDAVRSFKQENPGLGEESLSAIGGRILYDYDNGWFVAEIHSKAAACELGKSTDWCTAAPGLDFFGQYYKPEDPLFFFEQGSDEKPGAPGEKFQFHYGSKQFMDKDDGPLSNHWRTKLHNLLMQTEAPGKYPILRKQDRKFKLEDQSTSAEELAELADNKEAEFLDLTTIAMHPNVSPETLLKLASVSLRTKDYVGGEGWSTYATSLKEQIARNPNATSEALDAVWEESLKDYNTMKESALKILTKKKESDDLSDEWLEGALARRAIAIYGHWGAIWQRLVANENVSNELLNTIIETDFGEDSWDRRDAVKLLKDMVREKRASRKVGEEDLGYVGLRSRLIRRRSSRTSKALPPLAEQRIIQRWHKIIK